MTALTPDDLARIEELAKYGSTVWYSEWCVDEFHRACQGCDCSCHKPEEARS